MERIRLRPGLRRNGRRVDESNKLIPGQNGSNKCIRLMLHHSGRVSGIFEKDERGDTVYIVLVLEPTGSCFSYSCGDGQITRQVTKFATSVVWKCVRDLLAFRNRVCVDPFVDEAFASNVVEFGQRLRSIRWHTDPSNVQVSDDGVRLLQSVEGAATLFYKPGGVTFSVSILSPLTLLEDDYRYTSVKQTFFCDDAPDCYKHPLQLVMQYPDEYCNRESILSYVSQEVPRTRIQDQHWGDAKIVEDIILNLSTRYEGSICPQDPIKFEWNSTATYRCVNKVLTREVHVSVAADESMLILKSNGYFQHILSADGQERVYAPDGVPRVVHLNLSKDNEAIYELSSIANHAERLQRQRPMALDNVDENRKEPRDRKMIKCQKPYVTEEQHAVGLGIFTHYSDDRIMVLFEDRTLLSSNPGLTTCTVISGEDGRKTCVNVSRPCHEEQYVRSAQAFYQWVQNRSDPDRPARFENPNATRAQEVQQILSASRRRILCNRLSMERIDLLTVR